jgi:hypothetical protein
MGKMQERWTSCARDEIESEEVCLSLVTTAALFFVCRTMDAPSFYGEVGDVHTLSLWLMTKESGATLSVLVQATWLGGNMFSFFSKKERRNSKLSQFLFGIYYCMVGTYSTCVGAPKKIE